ncbi:MAG: transcription termination factor NusA [bacterium]
MLDLKAMNSALAQLEEEKGIPRDKVIEAIELALAAAYKKDYGKKNQIVRAKFDINSGATEFSQVKVVVDGSMLKPKPELDEKGNVISKEEDEVLEEGAVKKVYFNEDHHIMLADAKKIKKDSAPGDELIFSLESKDDYGRIAAQTAKQVIIQRIREAEKVSVIKDFGQKQGEVITGKVQRMEGGNVFVDLGRATGIITKEEQVPGERYRQGEIIRAYLYSVEESPRGINLKLSRAHPLFINKLFEIEAPEVANGIVEIKSIAREAGSRTKIAVHSNENNVDPVGSCVGQRGTRVSTIINELGGEKIDIIPWSEDAETYITNALSPAKVTKVEIDEKNKTSKVTVADDQFSLAIGKGGQNVRLAAKLTGWKIDIKSNITTKTSDEDTEDVIVKEDEEGI